jgi:multimeric flavodoxin WrbA
LSLKIILLLWQRDILLCYTGVMKLKAVILNCTLKKSPAVSNTQALIEKVVNEYKKLDVTSDVIRVADYNIPFGVSSNEGAGDEWPKVLKKLLAADIIIIAAPIWFGVRSSVAQLVIERLDGTYAQGDKKTGQFPLYNKVAGCIVTGNEDGAHDVAANTLFNLTHLGCVVPPNVDT